MPVQFCAHLPAELGDSVPFNDSPRLHRQLPVASTTPTTGKIGEVEEAEQVVIQMGAVWEDDSLPAVQQLRVVFGTLGVRAKTRASAAGFQ